MAEIPSLRASSILQSLRRMIDHVAQRSEDGHEHLVRPSSSSGSTFGDLFVQDARSAFKAFAFPMARSVSQERTARI